MVNAMARWNAQNPNMKANWRPPAQVEQTFDHLFSTDWHSPSERRIDGDRVTEMVPAREWLRGRSAHKGNLDDVNPLVAHNQNHYPPSLPRGMARDHLHDRNREHSLYNKANPALPTYVRVTRRRGDDQHEAALSNTRMQARRAEIAKEQVEAIDANHLLQMRSAGIRAAMARRTAEEARRAIPSYARPPPPPPPKDNPRVSELEKRLQVYETLTKVSPLYIDTTAQAGHNTANLKPAPALSERSAHARRSTMRGGTWPANFDYWSKTRASSASRPKEVAI
jgi:hypothetical protein